MKHYSLSSSYLILVACGIALIGCSSTPNETSKPNAYPNIVNNPSSKVTGSTFQPDTVKSSNLSTFSNLEQWKDDFAGRAQAKGYNPNDLQRMMSMASYSNRVVSLDSNQAEFMKMPWEYVEKAVSSYRVSKGREKFSDNASLFNELSRKYGVSPHIIAAIWGMESGYGSVTGDINLVSSLSSLAYEGRRRTFAESQLSALLTLLNRGDVSWNRMTGSWAGGMGHTQFIPATWLAQGVDHDYDGVRNPWSKQDALASTANYLSNSGWVRGLAPFIEVKLPSNFDFNRVGQSMSISQWKNMGVNPTGYNGRNVNGTLWLPAGKNGPALLTTKNFRVIKVYNNSNNYALGISLLAKKIAYQGGLGQPWPKYERPLTKRQVKMVQQRLSDMGYSTGGVDGVIGRNTRKAFRKWQARAGQVADGFICMRTASSLVR